MCISEINFNDMEKAILEKNLTGTFELALNFRVIGEKLAFHIMHPYISDILPITRISNASESGCLIT